MTVFYKGKKGQAYNVSSKNYLTNIELTKRLLQILDKPLSLIKRVEDRLGHDRRYAIDPSKLKSLGWSEKFDFEDGLRSTVLWYRDNEPWWKWIKLKGSEFQKYYEKAYSRRARK